MIAQTISLVQETLETHIHIPVLSLTGRKSAGDPFKVKELLQQRNQMIADASQLRKGSSSYTPCSHTKLFTDSFIYFIDPLLSF